MSIEIQGMPVDARGVYWINADYVADANAKYAAEEGKWTKWALPGFEMSTEQIGIDAREEADAEDAMWQEHWREQEESEKQDIAVANAEIEREDAAALEASYDELHQLDDENDEFEDEDPLAGDVDKYVDPSE